MPDVRVKEAVRAACCALVACLLASACSSLDHGSGPRSDTSSPAAQGVPLTARLDKVTGKLPKAARTKLRTAVGGTVDGWWQAAYLSTGGGNPYVGFTPGAAKLAKRDADLLSNAGLGGKASGFETVRRSVDLDVLAVKGKAKGVTARLHLTYDTTGDLTRRCAVGGTVSLTPVGASWRIFGYDVTHTCHPRKAGS